MAYDDITANNHGGDQFSQAAFERIEPHTATIDERIVEFMKSKPDKQTWVKEVRRALGMEHQTASASLSRLKTADRIGLVANGDGTDKRKEGCGVLQLYMSEYVKVDRPQRADGEHWLCGSCGMPLIASRCKKVIKKKGEIVGFEMSDKISPMERDPAPNGNCWPSPDGKPIHRVVAGKDRAALIARGTPLHLNHFARCPQADIYR